MQPQIWTVEWHSGLFLVLNVGQVGIWSLDEWDKDTNSCCVMYLALSVNQTIKHQYHGLGSIWSLTYIAQTEEVGIYESKTCWNYTHTHTSHVQSEHSERGMYSHLKLLTCRRTKHDALYSVCPPCHLWLHLGQQLFLFGHQESSDCKI